MNVRDDATHLDELRRAELEAVTDCIPAGAHILEIGAGTGTQAKRLTELGFSVQAIEIADSDYADQRVFPITEYDGRHVPAPAAAFDIIFTSNVLEHVTDLGAMHAEIRRVLQPRGQIIHVLPTHTWRAWTTATAVAASTATVVGALPRPAAWRAAARRAVGLSLPRRHGVRGTILSETWLYHPSWWKKHFTEHGFRVIDDRPAGVFYTGNSTLGSKVSINRRRRLAERMGSSCWVYVLSPL